MFHDLVFNETRWYSEIVLSQVGHELFVLDLFTLWKLYVTKEPWLILAFSIAYAPNELVLRDGGITLHLLLLEVRIVDGYIGGRF